MPIGRLRPTGYGHLVSRWVGQCRGTVSKLRDTLNMFNPLYPAVRAPRRDALQRAATRNAPQAARTQHHALHARNARLPGDATSAPAVGGASVY